MLFGRRVPAGQKQRSYGPRPRARRGVVARRIANSALRSVKPYCIAARLMVSRNRYFPREDSRRASSFRHAKKLRASFRRTQVRGPRPSPTDGQRQQFGFADSHRSRVALHDSFPAHRQGDQKVRAFPTAPVAVEHGQAVGPAHLFSAQANTWRVSPKLRRPNPKVAVVSKHGIHVGKPCAAKLLTPNWRVRSVLVDALRRGKPVEPARAVGSVGATRKSRSRELGLHRVLLVGIRRRGSRGQPGARQTARCHESFRCRRARPPQGLAGGSLFLGRFLVVPKDDATTDVVTPARSAECGGAAQLENDPTRLRSSVGSDPSE